MKQGLLVPGAVALLAAFASGCAVKSEIEPDWTNTTRVDKYAVTDASADGRWIAVGDGREVRVIDGESGTTRARLDDDFWRTILPHTVVNGRSISGFFSDHYKMALLDDAGVLLLFDYRFEEETITALDLESGERLWTNSELSYSLDKYDVLVKAAAEAAGSALERLLGGNAETETREDELAREHAFFANLIAPLDGSNDFLLKTFDGLVMIDARSGDIRWRVPEFQSAGLHTVKTLPGGDLLVLGGGRNAYNLELAQAYHLARISRDGRVRWRSEYSGAETTGLTVAGNRAVVDAAPLQVFDLRNGKRLWQNEASRNGLFHPAPVVTSNAVYQAANSLRENVKLIRAGVPYRIRKYDLDTGRELWASEETQTDITDLQLHDGRLLAAGDGDLFADGNGGVAAFDPDSGDIVWKSPPFEGSGLFSSAADASNIVASNGTVYVAGPAQLFALDIADGSVKFRQGLEAAGVGALRGIVEHGESIVVLGGSGIAGFDMVQGEQLFASSALNAREWHQREGRMVSEATGRAGELSAIDLDSGTRSKTMRYPVFGERIYGDLDKRGFVTEDGRHVFVINGEGNLQRFTL